MDFRKMHPFHGTGLNKAGWGMFLFGWILVLIGLVIDPTRCVAGEGRFDEEGCLSWQKFALSQSSLLIIPGAIFIGTSAARSSRNNDP